MIQILTCTLYDCFIRLPLFKFLQIFKLMDFERLTSKKIMRIMLKTAQRQPIGLKSITTKLFRYENTLKSFVFFKWKTPF